MILYIGNILSSHGNTPTFIETLGPRLGESFQIRTVSNVKNKVGRLIHMIWVYLRHFKSIRLVLIDTYSTLNFVYAIMFALIAQLTGRSYVPILRGGNLPSLLIRHPRVCKFVFRGAATLIAPSRYLVEEFAKQNYSVQYIPNFINIENYSFRERRNVKMRLCWVRAFQDIYNPILAVKVVKKLVESGYEPSLVMIGPDKGMRLEVERFVKEQKLERFVIFFDKLSKERWTKEVNEYDIFMNTTNFDNRPVTLIEAMALGLPIISTNVGGIPDLVTDHEDGLLVPPNDENAFAVCIEKLINDPGFALKLGLNGRAKAESFAWGNVKGSWTKIIGDVLQ